MNVVPSPITTEGGEKRIELPSSFFRNSQVSVRYKPEYSDLSIEELQQREEKLDGMLDYVSMRNRPINWLLPFVFVVVAIVFITDSFNSQFGSRAHILAVTGIFGLWFVLSAMSGYRMYIRDKEFKAVYNELHRTRKELARRSGADVSEWPDGL